MNASRRAIDLVLQNSTIDLFASYGIAIAPGEMSEVRAHVAAMDFTGAINFLSPGFRGTLTISAAKTMLAAMKQNIQDAVAFRDWIRELTNQLMGRIMNKLARYELNAQVVYAFRTRSFGQGEYQGPVGQGGYQGPVGQDEYQGPAGKGGYRGPAMEPDMLAILRAHIRGDFLSLSRTAPHVLEHGDVILFGDDR